MFGDKSTKSAPILRASFIEFTLVKDKVSENQIRMENLTVNEHRFDQRTISTFQPSSAYVRKYKTFLFKTVNEKTNSINELFYTYGIQNRSEKLWKVQRFHKEARTFREWYIKKQDGRPEHERNQTAYGSDCGIDPVARQDFSWRIHWNEGLLTLQVLACFVILPLRVE